MTILNAELLPASVDRRVEDRMGFHGRRAASEDAEEQLARRWRSRRDPRWVRVFQRIAAALERYHPVTIEGEAHLPDGPALLVGNHGHLGYETLLFCSSLLRKTGRLPHGLADRWFFRVPIVRDILVRLGGAYGHPANGRRLLDRGHWVVCYPGGAREVLKRSNADRYKLLWAQSRGFARLALALGVPIVPFAAAGVDDTFDVRGVYEGTGQLLMGHPKYDLPRLGGAGGAGILPHRVPFLFRFGPAFELGRRRDASEARVEALHRNVWRASQALLDETVSVWKRRQLGLHAVSEVTPCAP